jgi:chaperonin GroEL (HSP60 family)
MTDSIEDLMAAGILDPAKVTRSGLQNACGIAGIMLTTQAIMVQKPKAKSGAGAGGPGFSPSGMPAGLTM